MSSATSPRCGQQLAQLHAALRRACWNFHGLAKTLELAWAALSYLIVAGERLAVELRFSSGLGSNRSRWLGPPCMNSEIIARRRGGLGGALGLRSKAGRSSRGWRRSAAWAPSRSK